jgi:gamma-glutamylcyclotransferase (GGCT)/AIG2-like uncharacterized protein YtfP
MNRHLVFVYGTLRRGSPRAMSARFPKARFVTEATVSGSLFDLGAYPGFLLDDSNSVVVGEVYEVDDETLKELDDFESASHYWRKQVKISLGTQSKKCWIYAPNPDALSGHELITSGDWIEYAKTKVDRPESTGADEPPK